MRFIVLMTSHNRANLTVRCLQRLQTIADSSGLDIDVVLVDAGSADGTPEHARNAFRNLTVLSGDSDVFWARGMALAEKYALEHFPVDDEDFLVWLNDDVVLDDDAFERARFWVQETPEPLKRIYVGSMRDGQGAVAFGGIMRSRINPLGIRLHSPQENPVAVDTFHGNLVFVPVKVAKNLRGIDGNFGHHMADIDYGVRNTLAGNKNLLLPGSYGICKANGPQFSGRQEAWLYYRSIKGGGHWPTRALFMKKHSGIHHWPALVAMDVVYGLKILSPLRFSK